MKPKLYTSATARLIDEHLRWMRQLGRAESTIEVRKNCLARMARSVRPDLVNATAAELAAWRETITHLRPASAALYVRNAQGFWRWLRDDKAYRTDDPTERIPVPRVGRRRARTMPDKHVLYCIEQAPARIRPWLVLGAYCGLRAKEIALLRRENVFIDHPTPHLLVACDATKGDKERMVPLSPFEIAELERAGLPTSGWMFPRADGRNGPNRPSRVSQMVNRHIKECQAAGTSHRLRSWYARSMYRESGNNMRLVQELLGHSSPVTTALYVDAPPAEALPVLLTLPRPAA